jgi:hypothetical protein
MELAGCPDRWTDVFITKADETPSDGSKYAFDDTYCCSVQSIEFDPVEGYAVVTETDSPWICPTWTKEYMTSAAAKSEYKNLQVGDLVRIGEHDSQGFTDYLTIVEIKTFSKLVNGTSTELKISIGSGTIEGTDFLTAPTTSTDPNANPPQAATTVTTAGIAHIALRLNASLNCTKFPNLTPNNSADHIYARQMAHRNAGNTGSTYFADLSNRQHAYSYHSKMAGAYPEELRKLMFTAVVNNANGYQASTSSVTVTVDALDGAPSAGLVVYNAKGYSIGTLASDSTLHFGISTAIVLANLSEAITDNQSLFLYDDAVGKSTEKYFYPLYKAANWVKGTTLVAKLDHGVKQVSAVKLVGYTLVNKRAVGIQNQHEMQSDDYLILRIKEIEGHVISNNHHAHGAFAILRTGTSENLLHGSTQFSAYEPSGIVCVPVHSTNATLRNMTIEVTDRMGKPAHFGRFHLWFKLLVTHG